MCIYIYMYTVYINIYVYYVYIYIHIDVCTSHADRSKPLMTIFWGVTEEFYFRSLFLRVLVPRVPRKNSGALTDLKKHSVVHLICFIDL